MSLNPAGQLDLATVFIEKVREEVKKLLEDPFEWTEDVDLSERVLFDTGFPQFIGEVSANLERGISGGSKEEDTNICLR